MDFTFSIEELQTIINPTRCVGSFAGTVSGIASLQTARNGDLSFLGNKKYKDAVRTTQASVVLMPDGLDIEPASEQVFFFVSNPSLSLARVCARVEARLWPKPVPGVHPTAVIGEGCRIDETASVGPLCVLEPGVVVGAGCFLQASVFVGRGAVLGENCRLLARSVVATECRLGNRVTLQPGAIVGSDGFGYETVSGRHEKVPQIGRVIVEDDVEIGANATIDRARFSETVIGEGTKIDNLVQVGHNVRIGKHCLLCAITGISGSTTLGDYVVMGGMAGMAGHLTIGSGAMIAGQTAVISDVEPKAFVKGPSCLPYSLEQRIQVLRKRLPELFKRVEAIEAGLPAAGGVAPKSSPGGDSR